MPEFDVLVHVYPAELRSGWTVVLSTRTQIFPCILRPVKYKLRYFEARVDHQWNVPVVHEFKSDASFEPGSDRTGCCDD